MKYTQDLEKIVALTLCSAYIVGDKPLSLLLLSDRPESGKTEIVQKFKGTPKVNFVTDVSGFGIKRDFAEKIRQEQVTHIIIPELLQPLMKGKSTATSFVATLQGLMEDGLMGLHTGYSTAVYDDDAERAKTVGFIGCMPRKMYEYVKQGWSNSGFLSRWVVVSYQYSREVIDEILTGIAIRDYITGADSVIENDLASIKTETKQHIVIPKEVGLTCLELSKTITEVATDMGSIYGFRELKHILTLLASLVIYDRVRNGSTRTEATMEDYNEINRLSYLFNDQFNQIIKGKEGEI